MKKDLIICFLFLILLISLCGCNTVHQSATESSSAKRQEKTDTEDNTEDNADKGNSSISDIFSLTDEISEASKTLSIDVDILEKGDHRILTGIKPNFESRSDAFEHVYDDKGRLEKVVTTRNDGTERILFYFEYDSMGRVSVIHEGYSESGTWLKSIYERDSTGRKISQTNIVTENTPGGYCEYIYDASGKRIFDYWYTNGERQEYYYAYLYNEEGLRIEEQWRNTATDDIQRAQKYEYDSSKRLVKATSYFQGKLEGYVDIYYDGDKLLYTDSYDADGNSTYGKVYGIDHFPVRMFDYLYKTN